MSFSFLRTVLFRHCGPAGIVFCPHHIGMLNDAVEALFRDQLAGGSSECAQNTACQPSLHNPHHWFRPLPRRPGYARAIISLECRIQIVSQQRCRTREQGEGDSDPKSGVKPGGGRGAQAPADRRAGPGACAVDALLTGPFGQYETTGGQHATPLIGTLPGTVIGGVSRCRHAGNAGEIFSCPKGEIEISSDISILCWSHGHAGS